MTKITKDLTLGELYYMAAYLKVSITIDGDSKMLHFDI